MKKIMRKVSLCLCMLLIGASVASCGERGGAEGELYIKFYTGGLGQSWMDDMTKRFTAETGYKVRLDGSADMTIQAQNILESGRDIPDLLMVQYSNFRNYVQKGWVEPLDDIYSEKIYDGKSLEEIIEPRFVDYGKSRVNMNQPEHYYIVPWTAPTTGIAYNVNILKKVGFDQPPKNEVELKDLCAKLNKEGIIPFSWGGAEIGYWNFSVMTWWAQHDGVDQWNKFWEFENPEVYQQPGREQALRLWQELIVDSSTGDWKNSVEKPMGRDHMSAFREFVNEKAAMVPAGAWIENEIKDFIQPGFEMKIMPLPLITGAKDKDVINTEAGDYILIPSQATNKGIAKEFLKFMSREENLESFSLHTGVPRPFTNYKLSSIAGISPFQKATFELYENSTKLFRNSSSPLYSFIGLGEWQGKSLESVYAGLAGKERTTPKRIIDEIYADVNKNWKRWKISIGLE